MMKEHMNREVLSATLSGIRTFNKKALEIPDALLLTLGEPDFDTPSEIKDAVKSSLDENLTHYAPTQGYREVLDKISEYEYKNNNVLYESDEIVVTNGSTEGITSALFSILNPLDEVIIPTPAFGLYESSIKLAKGVYVPLDTSCNNFQISKEMIEGVITDKTKCIIITSPNNPTGTILTKESLDNIHNAIKNKAIFVITDDCYEQLVYEESALSFSQYQDIRKQIIITKSFSKSYAMTGWRVGYLLADRDIAAEIIKYHQFLVTTVNSFIQPACIKALDYKPTEMVNSYRIRRDYIYDRLVKMNFDVVKPEGAFYIFPSIKKYNMTSLEFCDLLLEKYHVALVPGIYFDCEGYVRISYCVKMETIVEAMNRLELFINELK